MNYRSKYLTFYTLLIGSLFLSVGFNITQNQEIKLLKNEKTLYRVFFEYLYDKVEDLENKQKSDKVYNII